MPASTLKRFIKRFIPHSRNHYTRMISRRVDPQTFERYLAGLGVEPGAVLFVHSSLTRLGHFPGGPSGVIESLQRLLGPAGTIAMPAFPFSSSMEDYVAEQPLFDLRTTPSQSGVLTEVLRNHPRSVRSLHPTHSVCAIGARADELVSGHEMSEGPCGAGSPFDRLAGMDARLLRIGTPALTLFHHLQERVDFPNLFLPDPADLTCIDDAGKQISVRTRVYRKGIPGVLFLGESQGDERLDIHPRNFPLIYSGAPEEYMRGDPHRHAALQALLEIRQHFEQNDWLRIGSLNGCQIEVFRVREYLNYGLTELQKLLSKFPDQYELSRLQRLYAKGHYPAR